MRGAGAWPNGHARHERRLSVPHEDQHSRGARPPGQARESTARFSSRAPDTTPDVFPIYGHIRVHYLP
jgi:hypothetical protein